LPIRRWLSQAINWVFTAKRNLLFAERPFAFPHISTALSSRLLLLQILLTTRLQPRSFESAPFIRIVTKHFYYLIDNILKTVLPYSMVSSPPSAAPGPCSGGPFAPFFSLLYTLWSLRLPQSDTRSVRIKLSFSTSSALSVKLYSCNRFVFSSLRTLRQNARGVRPQPDSSGSSASNFSSIPFRIKPFADHHPLNLIESHLYENHTGVGVPAPQFPPRQLTALATFRPRETPCQLPLSCIDSSGTQPRLPGPTDGGRK
jgi:hypothetical protein